VVLGADEARKAMLRRREGSGGSRSGAAVGYGC
jgi:hypothetical protein